MIGAACIRRSYIIYMIGVACNRQCSTNIYDWCYMQLAKFHQAPIQYIFVLVLQSSANIFAEAYLLHQKYKLVQKALLF
jgi:hypothetical protein